MSMPQVQLLERAAAPPVGVAVNLDRVEQMDERMPEREQMTAGKT